MYNKDIVLTIRKLINKLRNKNKHYNPVKYFIISIINNKGVEQRTRIIVKSKTPDSAIRYLKQFIDSIAIDAYGLCGGTFKPEFIAVIAEEIKG